MHIDAYRCVPIWHLGLSFAKSPYARNPLILPSVDGNVEFLGCRAVRRDEVPATRRWCRPGHSLSRSPLLVVVGGIPLQLAKQLRKSFLFMSSNEFFQGFRDGCLIDSRYTTQELPTVIGRLGQWGKSLMGIAYSRFVIRRLRTPEWP